MKGVVVKPLKVIPDDRGMVMEILRSTDKDMTGRDAETKVPYLDFVFGQAYLSTIQPGVIKAFHMHKEQTDRVCCIKGNIKLVLVEAEWIETCTERVRMPVETQVIYLGERSPAIVKISPGIWHGWTPTDNQEAFIINLPDKAYNHERPDEYREKYDHLYNWKVKNK